LRVWYSKFLRIRLFSLYSNDLGMECAGTGQGSVAQEVVSTISGKIEVTQELVGMFSGETVQSNHCHNIGTYLGFTLKRQKSMAMANKNNKTITSD
jgi:hypothetical protein